MKPAQKFMLGCRQTSEAASRLTDWLDLNPALLGAGQGAVREDLDGLAARLTPMALAADQVPGIGIVSTETGAKNDLLFALLGGRAPMTLGEFGQRPMEASTIRSMLPQEGEDGGCAIIRFSRGELPPAPRGYPIRAVLLSMIDVAAIMTKAAFAARFQVARLPDGGEIERLFGDVAGRLSPQAIPGLSSGDVLELRETLNALLPGHRLLPALAATRYWARFREIAPHISDRDRRRVLAVLWRNDGAFTALFNRLCDGLEKLGHGAEAYCGPDALTGKDKISGWMTRHPRSIIAGGTLVGLNDYTGPVLNVMNRFGQGVDIERSVMAGLIAELPLHLDSSRLAEIAPAEILDFPVPPPIGANHSAAVKDDLGEAAGHYARAKGIYLFERASLRRDVTSLVVVVDPEREDDTFAAALGDWVDSAQGQTAHARERVRRGLFIAARLPQVGRGLQAHDDGDEAEARVRRHIRDVIGEGQVWPLAWTPNRPMTGVFWFSGSDAGPAAGAWQPVAGMGLAVAQGPAFGVQAGDLPADRAVSELIASLKMASDERMRQVQLNQALADVRRRLHMCGLRHHASNDPAALADWRRGTAVVVQDRLQLIKESGRLGHLQRALLPLEADLATVMDAALAGGKAAAPEPGGSRMFRHDVALARPTGGELAGDEAGWTPQTASRMAQRCVEHWFSEMRRAARSGRLCRELRIEPRILHNVVDELQIGALRTALTSEIAMAYQRAPGDRPAGGAEVVRMASYAYRLISAYLEILAAPTGRGKPSGQRGLRALATEGEVAEAAAGGYATLGARSRAITRRAGRLVHEHWDVSFAGLVEDNIASAHLIAGRGDKDRELGELIALFASGPFEVEL